MFIKREKKKKTANEKNVSIVRMTANDEVNLNKIPIKSDFIVPYIKSVQYKLNNHGKIIIKY